MSMLPTKEDRAKQKKWWLMFVLWRLVQWFIIVLFVIIPFCIAVYAYEKITGHPIDITGEDM